MDHDQRNRLFLQARKLQRRDCSLYEEQIHADRAGNREDSDRLYMERHEIHRALDQLLLQLPEVRYWDEALWGKRPSAFDLLYELPNYEQLTAEGYR
jgi:hypothetical protein